MRGSLPSASVRRVAAALVSILLNPLLFHLSDRYAAKPTPETV